jgi:hypothetical protein
VRNGFAGTLWVGWRGAGSRLFAQLPPGVADPITLHLVELDTRRPLAYYKPDFIETVWRSAGPTARSVIYMDCDIVLGCDWAFLSAWVAGGLAVVEDLPHRSVGIDHPLRRAWKTFMTAAGVPPTRELGQYFNSGFVGVPRECRSILPLWSKLALNVEGLQGVRDHQPHFVRGVLDSHHGVDISADVRAIMRPFFIEDQDAFNMAVMASAVPLCSMGPDAMGFTPSRTPILLHALGPEKPWSTRYFRRLIRRGEGPSFAEDEWWRYSDHPIRVAVGARYAQRRLSWRAAKVMRRLL